MHLNFFFVFLGRPCVDCHAFEFMQRALQDLKKTAFNLDARVGEVWGHHIVSSLWSRDYNQQDKLIWQIHATKLLNVHDVNDSPADES